MVFEKRALLARERADPDAGIDSPRIEQCVLNVRNDEESLVAGECDVAFIKQVIDVRRQKEAVRAV